MQKVEVKFQPARIIHKEQRISPIFRRVAASVKITILEDDIRTSVRPNEELRACREIRWHLELAVLNRDFPDAVDDENVVRCQTSEIETIDDNRRCSRRDCNSSAAHSHARWQICLHRSI